MNIGWLKNNSSKYSLTQLVGSPSYIHSYWIIILMHVVLHNWVVIGFDNGCCLFSVNPLSKSMVTSHQPHLKDRAHRSTFKFSIFEKFSCFIVLVVFLVIVQSSELIYVWFCEKMTFKKKIISYHIFAIYVGGASLGVPTACRLIAASGARLPSADGLAVRCIKNAPPC